MDEDVDKILKKMADKKQKSMYRNIMTFDKMEQRLNVFYENNGNNEYLDDDNVGKLGKWMKMNQFDVDDRIVSIDVCFRIYLIICFIFNLL